MKNFSSRSKNFNGKKHILCVLDEVCLCVDPEQASAILVVHKSHEFFHVQHDGLSFANKKPFDVFQKMDIACIPHPPRVAMLMSHHLLQHVACNIHSTDLSLIIHIAVVCLIQDN